MNEALADIAAVADPVDRAKRAAAFMETMRTEAMPQARQIRQEAVKELRAEGKSLAEIGSLLGLDRNRVQQISEGRTGGKGKSAAPDNSES
ncbi:hypothetical protein Caci_2921 [Catenulispora acidiphila DSM 44928]|uniref:RNA polymerase sigma-70 region 4 domain-containing protein n=2 Tax=Catenulispora TaxID=414878 RepID=C7Q2T8_CATAD|nr:hypothetical protein Caci_2921 [Catenulispora acidiphila DSM 44928]